MTCYSPALNAFHRDENNCKTFFFFSSKIYHVKEIAHIHMNIFLQFFSSQVYSSASPCETHLSHTALQFASVFRLSEISWCFYDLTSFLPLVSSGKKTYGIMFLLGNYLIPGTTPHGSVAYYVPKLMLPLFTELSVLLEPLLARLNRSHSSTMSMDHCGSCSPGFNL